MSLIERHPKAVAALAATTLGISGGFAYFVASQEDPFVKIQPIPTETPAIDLGEDPLVLLCGRGSEVHAYRLIIPENENVRVGGRDISVNLGYIRQAGFADDATKKITLITIPVDEDKATQRFYELWVRDKILLSGTTYYGVVMRGECIVPGQLATTKPPIEKIDTERDIILAKNFPGFFTPRGQ